MLYLRVFLKPMVVRISAIFIYGESNNSFLMQAKRKRLIRKGIQLKPLETYFKYSRSNGEKIFAYDKKRPNLSSG